jgi:hypothetical protein
MQVRGRTMPTTVSVDLNPLTPTFVVMWIAFHASTAVFAGGVVYWRAKRTNVERAGRWGLVMFFATLLGSVIGFFLVLAAFLWLTDVEWPLYTSP